LRGRKSDGRSAYDEAAERKLIVVCLKPRALARMAMEHSVDTNVLKTWITAYGVAGREVDRDQSPKPAILTGKKRKRNT